MKVTVLGAGAWGTALAKLLHEGKHQVTLWGHDPGHLHALRSGRNDRYMPGVPLPLDWTLESDLTRAAAGTDCLIVAVPSKAFRGMMKNFSGYSSLVVSVTKGIEYDTGLTMCGVLRATIPRAVVVALSGPTFALEVARGVPSAIVAGSDDLAAAAMVQQLLHRPTFRVYTSADVLGVELGGALKNVIAIAAGVGDGLGFGDNSKAAIITRAIVEMRRLGAACGAQPETFFGLSGLGDLTATCFSRLSRNRGLGERLGRGEKLEEILAKTVTVAEGYPTARSAYQLAQRLKVVAPIINETYAMLYQGKNVAKAVQDLIGRDSKAEN